MQTWFVQLYGRLLHLLRNSQDQEHRGILHEDLRDGLQRVMLCHRLYHRLDHHLQALVQLLTEHTGHPRARPGMETMICNLFRLQIPARTSMSCCPLLHQYVQEMHLSSHGVSRHALYLLASTECRLGNQGWTGTGLSP